MTRVHGSGALLLLFLAATPLFADAADARAVVREFYTAYAAGDAARAASFWSESAKKEFASKQARAFRNRCVALYDLAIVSTQTDGDKTIVNVDALWSRWSAISVPTEADRHHGIVTLQREQGAWKIAAWQTAEERLAEDAASAPTRAAREAIVRARPDLRTRQLADSLSRQAVHRMNQSDRVTATEFAAMAREIAEELGDPGAISVVLSTESVIARARPLVDAAISLRLALESVEMAERTGDPDVIARALQRLGRSQLTAESGGYATSFERVLALDEHLEDASTLALAASQMAWFVESGVVRDKLRYAVMASRYADESGDPVAIINAEMNLIGNHISLGDRELAVPHAQRAIELAEKRGMKAVQADLLEVLAVAELQNGRRERFLEYSNRALALLGPNDFATRADVLVGQAEYWYESGDFDTALRLLEEADTLLVTVERSATRMPLHNTYAMIFIEQKRYSEALEQIARWIRDG